MISETWIEHIQRLRFKKPVAIVGSPGIRSVGKLAIEGLVEGLQANLTAELFSTHFPIIYHTQPSYAPHPQFPGDAGIKLYSRKPEFPRVQFYTVYSPFLIITKGYHANFKGQYEVAEKVLDFFNDLDVKRMIVLAGYGSGEKKVCCAATDMKLIEEMKEYGIDLGYQGPFYGFSGLVFGLAKKRNIHAVCLFSGTLPNLEDPEFPDPDAAKAVLSYLIKILKLKIELS